MSSIYQNKRLYCLLAIVFLFATNMAIGQGVYNTTSWRFSNPKQFGFSIADVDYFDNNNVIAVGSDGGIAKSTDGGTNWTYGVFTCNNPAGMAFKTSFNDVHYVTASVAYAVGTNGVMAKTTDGGITWNWVSTPLFANAKVLNACWFLDANKGYIGGQNNNTIDSFPKLYVTLNGGSTWDSIAAPPVNGVSRVGYINNVNIPSVLWPLNAKLKEIYRIEFTSTGVGYISGTSNSSNYFPAVSLSANAATCLPTASNLTSSGSAASLLWKFQNGVLTDYSISKERLGYSGINTNTVTCTTSFAAAAIAPVVQGYKAMNIINDSMVVLMSFNNNTVVRVRTGVNDFTPNLNNSNALEKGKYETLNFPFPPNQGPQAGPPIPPVQVLLASNPAHIIRSSNGTLVAGSVNSTFSVTPGALWTSTDTGRNWIRSNVGPQGRNWTPYAGAPALDFAPNGKLLALGFNGVVADSTSGGTWQSNHTTLIPAGASFNDMEFVDCNNGITAGGATIVVTSDGGKTWVDKTNGGLAGLNANITSVTYPQLNKVYFTTSIGTIYRSINQGTNLTPVFVDNLGGVSTINDLALAGTDSIWACGVQQSSLVPALQRFGFVYRSFNNGVTWDTVKVGPLGNVGTQAQQFVTFRGIEFPSRNVGYACGSRGAVYKTIDAGATWTNISPFPAINISPAGFANSAVLYTDIIALDNNTVFVVGNMFTSANNRRIYKTTDGGANWVDISSNIDLISPGGNLNAILMHDANNGYVVTPGGVLLKTTNGGVSWTLDLAPSGTIFATMAFAPKTVPAGITMQNRKLFVCGANVSGAPIMEYGNPANVNVNSTETINGSCVAGANGSIVINATGGIAPYTYSLNGGPYQSSNTFNGVASGNQTISVKDAYCGLLTKTIVVTIKPAPGANAGPDKIIVDGDEVTLDGSGTATSTTIAWTPNTTLTGANTFTPVAKPHVTTTYTMTVTDNNNCTSTDNTVITVVPYCVKPMAAFTPNGDGINDRWLVTTNSGICVKQVIAKVFNRYGELVYSNDFYNNDWDGSYKGKAVADGTYYYVIQYRLINGNSIPLKGDVTILR